MVWKEKNRWSVDVLLVFVLRRSRSSSFPRERRDDKERRIANDDDGMERYTNSYLICPQGVTSMMMMMMMMMRQSSFRRPSEEEEDRRRRERPRDPLRSFERRLQRIRFLIVSRKTISSRRHIEESFSFFGSKGGRAPR